MARQKRKDGLLLKFGTITCTRCNGVRLLARECHDCGAKPKHHEVQHDLQRRERIVVEFREKRQPSDRDISPVLDSLPSELDRAIKHVLRALADSSRTDRTADSLVAAFALLDQLVANWQNQLPRPERNRGKIIGSALQKFAEGADLFVEALRAPDMLSAQNLELQGNTIFEEAESILADISRINQADEVFSEESPSEALNNIGRSARQLAGYKSSLKELDQALRAGVGWESASEGMGLQAHTIHSMALSSFDLDSFTQILSASDAAVGTGSKGLMQSEEWKRRHARAAAFLGSAAASVHQGIFTSGSSDFEVAHRAVEAVATFRDGVLKHTLATMLSSSIEEYLTLSRKNGGAVIAKAASGHPELLLDENLTPALRNAGAHADIDLSEHGLKIDGNYFSTDHFIDRFLAYLETVIATFVGVTLAVARHGIDFEYNQYLAPRDRDAAVALLLGAFSLHCDSVDVNDEGAIIHASGPAPDWMTLAAVLSAVFSDSITLGTICVATPSREHVFVTSLDRFRTHTEGLESLDAKQSILRLTAITAASSLDGGSPWSKDEWDRVARAIIVREDSEDLRAWVRGIRELRGYAREAHLADVASACDDALAALRQ